MATRFWLTNAAAPYTPATRRGSWTTASGEDVQLLGRKPQGSAGTSSIALAAGSGTRKVLLHRSISAGAVKAGTISGTVTWCIGAKESNALLDAVWHLHIYVTSGDSDTPRGTLLSNFTGATEFSTTATGATEGAQAVSSVAVQTGDRLVVEIGYETSTTTAASYNATINYGSTGTTDLTNGDTAVTTDPGWVEFSGTDGLFTPAFATLTDTFASSIDSKWTKTTNVSATGGRCRIPCTTILEDVYTSASYEIQGSSVAWQVPTVPAAGGGSNVAFSAYLSAGPTVSTTNLEFEYSPNTGNLVLRNSIGGTDASPTTLAYDSTAHQWWRFREAGGQLFMETSPDNSTWTTRRTISSPTQWMRLGTLILYFEAQRGSGTADNAEIDNINVSSNTTLALSAASSIETAQHLTGTKTRTAGIAATVETAQRLTGTKTRTAGIAGETTTARAITGAKSRALGTAQETTAAQALARTKTLTLTPASSISHALALAGTKQITLAPASEPATAQGLGKTKTRTLTYAGEINTARALSIPHTNITLGLRLTGITTPWAAHGTSTAWHCTGRTTPVDSLSTEYYEAGITWDHGSPTTYDVSMAVMPVGHDPDTADWHTAEWSTNSDGTTVARLLVGPDGGALSPLPGRYRTWVKVTATPETPVLYTAPFDIN